MAKDNNQHRKIIQVSITIISIVLIVCHLIWPTLKIDAVTLTLFIIAVLPWLSPLFKAIELPGGLKIEYADLEKAGEEAKKAGLIQEVPAKKEVVDHSLSVLAKQDINLALAYLRIEIEKRLRKVAEKNNVGGMVPLWRLMETLFQRNLITEMEKNGLADIINILNNARHGVEYDKRIADWVIDIGPKLLYGLDEKLK